MRSRRSLFSVFFCLCAALLLAAGCWRAESTAEVAEVDDPDYRKAKEMVRQGRTSEALAAYDRVLVKRGLNKAPETHLDMAIIYQQQVRDYLTAIYHYQKYMAIMRNSPQRAMIEQRIDAAKRDYMSTLPGRPSLDLSGASPDYAETINRLRAQNERLRADLAVAQAAAARVPINTSQQTTGRVVAAENPIVVTSRNTQFSQAAPVATRQPDAQPAAVSQPAPQPQQAAPARRHVVRQGDSLYNIARQHYGSARNAQVDAIVNANRDQLQSRNTPLRVGMELRIP
ncbi:tetratricopeptide (TPR) repeat protein [Ereboglobus sp. PH5-10]|uniref:LysM peptidoglycan-binding domain-containing protein n=1 Tax=Ereboglobus sp. PH5-10 TaxID=2940629 RepID=UPI0024070E14|nr:LysM peptidoglycan-binding domain-containing protein [Ereboglobus sp. PH5-10]MDF9828325.1 tetratricopeptide (TPR) repeat protein [Ereboglobus sp. PH5-10]